MPRHDPRTVQRARSLTRIVGAILGILLGTLYGIYLAGTQQWGPNDGATISAYILSAACAGGASLALAAPLVTVEPYLWLESTLATAPPAQLVGSTIGLTVALVISALLTVLLSGLPWGMGFVVSSAVACVLVYVGVQTGSQRRNILTDLLEARTPALPAPEVAELKEDGRPIVVDTSVLVDGRITDVAATGFIQGRLVIAGFVLEELQRLADASDAVKRARGKRGLQVVERLQASGDVVCEVVDASFSGVPEVDAQLVRLAMARRAALMTNDFNLNRLARIEGVRVLNLNDLANAVKPVVSAGEQLTVAVTKEGKELHQGVGYLEDGTMVVIENARPLLGQTVAVTVSSILQTPQGRLIFASVPHRADPEGARGTGGQRRPRDQGRPPRVANR